MYKTTADTKTITQERKGVTWEFEELISQNTRLMVYYMYFAHFYRNSLYVKWKAYKQYTPLEEGVLTIYFNHVICNKMMK